MKTWEVKVLRAPGAPERVDTIEDELRLAQGLTALRERAGLSQRELAKLIGIAGWRAFGGVRLDQEAERPGQREARPLTGSVGSTRRTGVGARQSGTAKARKVPTTSR